MGLLVFSVFANMCILMGKYRELHPPIKGSRQTSMNGKNGSPEDMRLRVISKFIFTEEIKQKLIIEIQNKINETMFI